MSANLHVAIIMDGAGRWAVARGLDRRQGHAAGVQTAHRIIASALDAGVGYLTLHTFALANWQRPREQVEALMAMIVEFADHQREFCSQNGIRVGVIGQLDELHTPARHAIERLTEATSGGARLRLTLALSYGGQADIAQAARVLAAHARAGLVVPEEIDAGFLHRHMTTGDLPPVDVLIRTGGRRSLDDFLLFECNRAELVFLPELWPELTPGRFVQVLSECSERAPAPPARPA